MQSGPFFLDPWIFGCSLAFSANDQSLTAILSDARHVHHAQLDGKHEAVLAHGRHGLQDIDRFTVAAATCQPTISANWIGIQHVGCGVANSHAADGQLGSWKKKLD